MSIASEHEIIPHLRLFRSEGVGARTFASLLSVYGTAENALQAIPNIASKIKLRSIGDAEKELRAVQKFGAEILLMSDPRYPQALAATEGAPPLITVKGNADLLQKNCIGIVGARNASLAGMKISSTIAEGLGKANCIVVSGLARGIDTAAHKAALKTGTVAVIAGGIDSIYPPENKPLYQQIYEQGLVIAELPFGASPKAEHFPQRNRIISGVSRGVAVIEATLRSGSLITARLALEQGREVFAVPGSPLDPRAEGPNRLIKQGATLIESAEDIVQNIFTPRTMPLFQNRVKEDANAEFESPPQAQDFKTAEGVKRELKMLLSTAPTHVDELLAKFTNDAKALNLALLEMELNGQIERLSGNKVVLCE